MSIFNRDSMSKSKVLGIILLIVVILGGGIMLMRDKQTTLEVKEPITIGALYPLTGGLAIFGQPAQKTATLALEEINATGGINGRPLALDIQDQPCNPATVLSLYNQLYDAKNIRIFTSATCSGGVLTIAPTMKDSVLLVAITTSGKISGVSPRVFRNWASDALEAKLFADEIKNGGQKSVGVIYEQTDYAKGLKDSLEKYLEGTDVKVISESFASDASDVRTQLTKLNAQNPDVWFLSPQTVITGDKILKQMQELHIKPRTLFVNDAIIKAKDVIAQYKGLLEGALGADYVITDVTRMQSVLEKYKQKYGEECSQPNVCAVVYDNINMLAEALKKNGEDADKVREYLKGIQYNGVSGEVSFDEKNDRAGAGYSLFLVKDGVAVLK